MTMYSYSPVYKEEDDLMFDMEEDEMANTVAGNYFAGAPGEEEALGFARAAALDDDSASDSPDDSDGGGSPRVSVAR